jgi:hypothetical protein
VENSPEQCRRFTVLADCRLENNRDSSSSALRQTNKALVRQKALFWIGRANRTTKLRPAGDPISPISPFATTT